VRLASLTQGIVQVLQVEKISRRHKTDLVKVVTAWEIENDDSEQLQGASQHRQQPQEAQPEVAGPQPPLAGPDRTAPPPRHLGSGNLVMPYNSRASFLQPPSEGFSEDPENDRLEPQTPNPKPDEKADALSHESGNSMSMREDYLPRYAQVTSIPDSSRGKDLKALQRVDEAAEKKYFYSFDQMANVARDQEVALSSQSMNKCSLC